MNQFNYNPNPGYESQSPYGYAPQATSNYEVQSAADSAFKKSLIGLILGWIGITIVGIFFSIGGFNSAKQAMNLCAQYGIAPAGKLKAAKIMGIIGIILNIVSSIIVVFVFIYWVAILGYIMGNM